MSGRARLCRLSLGAAVLLFVSHLWLCFSRVPLKVGPLACFCYINESVGCGPQKIAHVSSLSRLERGLSL